MDLTITALIDRLCCPAYQSVVSPHADSGAGILAPYLQGQVLHAVAETYLRGEPVAAAFNLLGALPEQPEFRSEMIRRACNMLSVANQLCAGALAVEAEAPLSVMLPAYGYTLHGFCDCLIVGSDGRVTVLDWKPGPRPDGLDELQVKAYLAAALAARGQEEGNWVLYYYSTGGLRRGTGKLAQLMTELGEVLEQAIQAGHLRAGTHCAGCALRKECHASAWTMG